MDFAPRRLASSGSSQALAAVFAAALLAALPSAPARADSPPQAGSKDGKEKEKEAARALAQEGYDLFTDGKFALAADKLDQAEAIFHAPTHLELAGRALEKAGRLLAARERYERTVAETPSPKWSKEFLKSHADAQKALAALKSRIPTLQIRLSGAPADKATVTIGGASLSAADYASPHEVDPGKSTVQIEAPDTTLEVREITLAEGEKRVLDVTLRPRAGHGALVPGVVGVGLGAVGIAVGGVTGVMSLGAVGELDKACPDKRCPSSAAGDLDRARTLSTVSTIGFAAGAALAAAGVVLILVRPGAPKDPATTGLRLTPVVGPLFIGLKGEM